MMIFGFGFMLWLDVKLALIAVAYFPIVIFVMIRFRATVEDRYRLVQDQFGEISNRVQENISGIRAVKAYAQEESEVAKFATTTASSCAARCRGPCTWARSGRS